MPRFRRFEVKREMSDGEKIRQDEKKKTELTHEQFETVKAEIERDGNLKEGFGDVEPDLDYEEIDEEIGLEEDFDIDNYEPDLNLEETDKENTVSEPQDNTDKQEEQNKATEIKLDEKGNPILPEGWTFLTHGSSFDRWDTSLLGSNFIVGTGMANGEVLKNRALCCVEKSVAQFDYKRDGSNTAKSYGGKEGSFEIRVLFYKNPRLGSGKEVRERLNSDQLKDVNKYYMYQGGRHPAVPVGTKLLFLNNGDFDEITGTKGNNILWYIPEQYLEQYLEDARQYSIDTNEKEATTISNDTLVDSVPNAEIEETIEDFESEEDRIARLNEEVKKEIREEYTDDITNDYLEAYLIDKITGIYGADNLAKAGIADLGIFLKDEIYFFEGVESYEAIIDQLEFMMEYARTLNERDAGNEEIDSLDGTSVEDEVDIDDTQFESADAEETPNMKLIETYEKTGITASDLNAAYAVIGRTKEEREQSQNNNGIQHKPNDFEGR